MDKLEQAKTEIERLIKKWHYGRSAEAKYRCEAYKELLEYIASIQGEPLIVYVVTRSEEHSDYVEKVFLEESKAEEYCKQFENDEDEYGRDITKIKVAL